MKKITNMNAMFETNSNLQYYLTTNVNIIVLKKYLFQFHNIFVEIEIIFKFLSNEKINFFMSYRLQNTKIKYFNSKEKCFAIVKNLIEIK